MIKIYLCFSQSFQDKSYAAKYFAAKSEDLSAIFPKKQNNNEMLTNNYKEKHCSLLGSSDKKTNQECNFLLSIPITKL